MNSAGVALAARLESLGIHPEVPAGDPVEHHPDDEGRSFTWSAGSAVSRGVGEHVLTPRDNGGCTATLRLTQRGPGARLVGVLLHRITRRYLRMDAEGLKARSERDAGAVH